MAEIKTAQGLVVGMITDEMTKAPSPVVIVEIEPENNTEPEKRRKTRKPKENV